MLKDLLNDLTSLQKLGAFIVVCVIALSSFRGAWAFANKDGPALLGAVQTKIENVELKQTGQGTLIQHMEETHVEDVGKIREEHATDVTDVNSKLDYLVCLRKERGRELEGLPPVQDCEDIIF